MIEEVPFPCFFLSIAVLRLVVFLSSIMNQAPRLEGVSSAVVHVYIVYVRVSIPLSLILRCKNPFSSK